MRGPGGRRLRVAHLTTIDASLDLLLATELVVDVEAGFETIGISAPGDHVARVEGLGVTHAAVPFTRAWNVGSDLRSAWRLARVLRRLHLDVLHTHTPKAGVLGRVLGRALRIPVVVNTCHGLWLRDDSSPRTKALVTLVEGVAARCSHHELFQNAQDRETLRWAVPEGRATVVGNGIDLTRFRFDPAARAALRAEWGVADDTVLVGGVGRLVAEKGIPELGEAAGALGDLVEVVWIGGDDGEKADALEGDTAGIRFVGRHDDMPAVHSALDVFVLPSHREGFSRSAMEAAACGRAMVLSDIRGCREVGADGEELLLVPAKDPAALTEAIRRLAVDPDLRAQLGAAALARSAAFDQRSVAAASIATYDAVARRKGLGWLP